ncbi:hypothetical protein [Nitrospirillum viridazoti]|uniref:Uncharacterized protein n=1 Tax=Nitrospirillum viridazoti CBAmc TaxID=1441467 RepID=A0A248JSB8_9PROT|nr:hypothetical protein [Nitrospirillum amazonense]ASG21410.1 hypothetical protein Y958_11650 [Nitrospirillum amazonense CBAmc]TWB33088.1 hypothetical protein FBZ91_115150 [Nitrospirillum amazonense]
MSDPDVAADAVDVGAVEGGAAPPEAGPTDLTPESVATLRAWRERYCRDSALSRDTPALNLVSALLRQVEDVLLTVEGA